MDPEITPVEDPNPTPTEVVTATTEAEQVTPEEVKATKADEQKPNKVFTQEEVDKIVEKRLARQARQLQRTQSHAPTTDVEGLSVDQFDSPEEYARVLAEKIVEQREQVQEQRKLNDQHFEREESARDKYDDYDVVVYNPKLTITAEMAQTIRASDLGPEVAYYLGSNPGEAERIAKLPAFVQAKEIGRLEQKLGSTPPPVKTVSKAPDPIKPIQPRSIDNGTIDTTDPRSVEKLSTADWIAAERQRQIRLAQARTH